jgi:DNA mismatch repair protein MLH3
LIGQADGKFVACVLRDLPGQDPVLVLIDQHAADERVRVEKLLEEYCGSALVRNALSIDSEFDFMTHLDTPLKILLTTEEASLLQRTDVVEEFARWGIEFEDHVSPEAEEETSNDMIQVSVNAIPTILRDKVRITHI